MSRFGGRSSDKAGARDMNGDDRRFHLSFEYVNPEKGWVNKGDQVVMASSLDEAARRIAQELGIKQIKITKRHFYGKSANESENINKVFRW